MNKFREDLIKCNKEFSVIFKSLIESGKIQEFPDILWDIINRDKTPIRINGEPLAFKDLFHLNYNEGRCKICVFELVFLFDKLGIYSEAIKCVNSFLIGTTGSTYGGHWYVEAHAFGEIFCIDTSLVIIGTKEGFNSLGHKVLNTYDIDTLFKQNSQLIDYYDQMIINKNLL